MRIGNCAIYNQTKFRVVDFKTRPCAGSISFTVDIFKLELPVAASFQLSNKELKSGKLQ